jgi:cytidine deaminase
VHFYEGHAMETVTFAVRVLGRLGVKDARPDQRGRRHQHGVRPGALMVIDDHINLMGTNPLVGPNDERFGARFPDMTEVYSKRLRAARRRGGGGARHRPGARRLRAVHGPSYETPAEIRYLRTIGADAVGMSTVPEAIVARHMGLEVLGISCITNMAAGVLPIAARARRGDGDRAPREGELHRPAGGVIEREAGRRPGWTGDSGARRRARAREAAIAPVLRLQGRRRARDGRRHVVTGCNIENATYGLTMCAERVALFKALSDGTGVHAASPSWPTPSTPTPPCGPCRQLLWEYGGDLEVVLEPREELAARMSDLLPLPFDAAPAPCCRGAEAARPSPDAH